MGAVSDAGWTVREHVPRLRGRVTWEGRLCRALPCRAAFVTALTVRNGKKRRESGRPPVFLLPPVLLRPRSAAAHSSLALHFTGRVRLAMPRAHECVSPDVT